MSQAAAEIDPDDLAPRHDVPRDGRSGFTLIDGRQVHYLEWGHRALPPVLALHGGGQTAYMYEELGSALSGRYHVLAPDLPAHGDSDPIGSSFDAAVAWRISLAATLPALLDNFGMESCPIVGASLGGITGITFAARAPERVTGLVLIDVGHRLEEQGVRKIVHFLTAHESFASLEEAAAEIARYLPHRKEVRPASLTRNLRQRPDGRWEWKHQLGRRMRDRQAAAADEQLRHDAVLDGLEEDAAGLTCPVLVLRGAESDVLSSDGAAEVTDLIPQAELAVIEQAGHLAAGDNPASTVALIAPFLDRLHH